MFYITAVHGYGALIKAAREAEGITQGELAKALWLENHSDVSRIESEKKIIDPGIFARLFTALPSLSPSAVVVAMGYPIEVAKRDAVPEELAEICADLAPDQLRILLRVARGLRAEHPRRK